MFYIEFPEKLVLKRVLTGLEEADDIDIINTGCIHIYDRHFELTVVDSSGNSRTTYEAYKILSMLDISIYHIHEGTHILNCVRVEEDDGEFRYDYLRLINIDIFSFENWCRNLSNNVYLDRDCESCLDKSVFRDNARKRGFDSYFQVNYCVYYNFNKVYVPSGKADNLRCHCCGISRDGRYMVCITKTDYKYKDGVYYSSIVTYSLYKDGILVSDKCTKGGDMVLYNGLLFNEAVYRLFDIDLSVK